MKIPNKFRLALARKYLDCAEVLPKFGGGPIAMLQSVRERQRKGAKRAYERSRPPQNTRIELLSFRLIEVFPVEEIDRLRGVILRYFPSLDDDLRHKLFSDDLRYQAENLFGTAWWNLGFLVRDFKGRFFGGQVCPMEKLPPEVDYIQVGLSKISPSLFVVTLDVHLENVATETLLRMQDAKYLPEIRFRRLLPVGIRGYAHSRVMADAVMRKTILSWLKELQGKVETSVKPFVSGYFTSQSEDKLARLPSIKVYAIKGIPKKDEQTLQTWIDSSRGWWSSLGFNFYGFDLYSDGNLIFTLDEDESPVSLSSYRMVVIWEAYLESINVKPHGDDEKAAALANLSDTLQSILPGIAILEFLRYPQRRIAALRNRVFSSIRNGRPRAFRLNRFIKLSDQILLESVSLGRIISEFKQERRWLAHEMKGISELRQISRPGKETKDLGTLMLETIEYRTKLLEEHISFIKDWFSQYLTLRNMAATYWLAVIVLIATLVDIVGVDNIRQFVEALLTGIRNLLS